MSRFIRLPLMTMLVLFLAIMLAACGITPSTTGTQVAGTQPISVKDALGGTLSMTIPTGTLTRTDEQSGMLTVGTSEAALSTTQTSTLPAGQWGLAVGALPNSVAQALVPGGQTVTPQTMIDALKTQMAQTAPQATFSASSTTTIGGHDAARVTGTSPQGDVLLIVVALDSSYLLATSVTSVGELATHEPTLTNIISSASYTPAP